MQKFKQIREAAKYNPYAIGMAAAKKKAGIGPGPKHDLPKSVIVKGHEIAKKIKANEDFDAELDQLDFELMLESLSAEDIQAFMESEDFEQLDEVSKATMASYVKKASADIAKREVRIDRALDPSGSNYNEPSMQKALNKNVKRVAGLNKATDKLAKE